MRGFLNLLFHFCYMRFIQFFGKYNPLKVIGNDEPVAVPDDFSDKSVYEEFSHFNVIRILKYFG